MAISEPQMVEIYRAKSLPQAQVIRIALAQAGIHAFIDGELLQGVVGELPMGWVTAPRIKVDQSKAQEALEIIESVEDLSSPESLEQELDGTTRCLACGDSMSDSEVTCAACGWSFLGEEAVEQF